MIRDTCPCGADFATERKYSTDEKQAHAGWLLAHADCRATAARPRVMAAPARLPDLPDVDTLDDLRDPGSPSQSAADQDTADEPGVPPESSHEGDNDG